MKNKETRESQVHLLEKYKDKIKFNFIVDEENKINVNTRVTMIDDELGILDTEDTKMNKVISWMNNRFENLKNKQIRILKDEFSFTPNAVSKNKDNIKESGKKIELLMYNPNTLQPFNYEADKAHVIQHMLIGYEIIDKKE